MPVGGRKLHHACPAALQAGSPGHGGSQRAKPLSLLPLIALIFYDVSGGPFGIEVRLLHDCA